MLELFTVATITILAVISPGADFAMVSRNSMMMSRRAGVLTAVGISLGVLVHVAYSLLGVGLVISRSVLLFNLIKYLGAAYLIYLGLSMVRARPRFPAQRRAGAHGRRGAARRLFDQRHQPQDHPFRGQPFHPGHKPSVRSLRSSSATGPSCPWRISSGSRWWPAPFPRLRPSASWHRPAAYRAGHRLRAGLPGSDPGPGLAQAGMAALIHHQGEYLVASELKSPVNFEESLGLLDIRVGRVVSPLNPAP
jgi:hypothetical protein